MTIAFVRGVNLLASSSGDRTQSPLDSTAPSPFWQIIKWHKILNYWSLVRIALKLIMQLTHRPQRYVDWLSSSHHHHGLIAVKERFNNYDLKYKLMSVLCSSDNYQNWNIYYVVYIDCALPINAWEAYSFLKFCCTWLLHCQLSWAFVYLIPFINQSLKCREESLICSNCHQDVFQRINLMSHYPTEEFSQAFNERDVALRRTKWCSNVSFLQFNQLEYCFF